MEENFLLFLIAFIRIWEAGFLLRDGERALPASSNTNYRYGKQQK